LFFKQAVPDLRLESNGARIDTIRLYIVRLVYSGDHPGI